MAIWTPNLAERRGPKYLQIVEALAEDIVSGALVQGTRLPPHRELAFRLGVSPNTTSRAYAEGVARALLRGEVGRGTFVRETSEPAPVASLSDMRRPATGPIDLSRNLPAPGLAAEHLASTLAALNRTRELRSLLDYQTEADLARHSEAAVAWLRRSGVDADRDEVVITNGAQHGILVALMTVTRPHDLLLTEQLTYAPVKTMAERLELKLAPVPIDDAGLCPDQLLEICRTHAVKALYFTPTLQSPTTATMQPDRRKAVAEAARRHDFLLIEDDVCGLLQPDGVRPVTAYAPERTIYITSTSKCLAPGLRVGFVRAPAEIAAAIRGAVNLTCWMTPPLMAEIAARWITDGTADRLTKAQRDIASRRQNMARSILGDHEILADPFGLHLWLKLPEKWSSDAFRAEAGRRDVRVTEGAAFAVTPGAAPRAVRLCLSHEADESRLKRGLDTLRKLLDGPSTGTTLLL
ncbi:MAG: PLP-dependent aminotransferase family protein [Pseudomonadota bacterium]